MTGTCEHHLCSHRIKNSKGPKTLHLFWCVTLNMFWFYFPQHVYHVWLMSFRLLLCIKLPCTLILQLKKYMYITVWSSFYGGHLDLFYQKLYKGAL